jgi:hypothetical protein
LVGWLIGWLVGWFVTELVSLQSTGIGFACLVK